MLKLLLGGSGSGKTTLLYQRIRARAEAGEKSILLVPEQFTSSTEGRIHRELGDALSGLVESFSFTSLAEHILSAEGGSAVQTLSDAGRAVLVRRALEELQDNVHYYYRHRRSAAFCQMAAETIGIPTEDVHIVSFQDTDTAPFDTGAYASRQTYVTGKAIQKTGRIFRARVLEYAAEVLQLDQAALDIRGRDVVEKTSGAALLSLESLAMEAFYSLEHSVHITAEATSHCKENTFAFGCCFAEVEVDIPLGKVKIRNMVNVHDSGKLINPALAEAQVHGGMSMGIGYALSEEMKFDDRGRLLNGNLLDYKLPTAMDHPELRALFVETDDPSGPFGNKALGEPPSIPVAPAIRNAILQATGVALNRLPMNPQRLVEAFTAAGLIDAKGE